MDEKVLYKHHIGVVAEAPRIHRLFYLESKRIPFRSTTGSTALVSLKVCVLVHTEDIFF